MFTEDQLLPLSALQHWLFCPRQCALIHLEQTWEENLFTAEGRAKHERAHHGPDERRPGLRVTRGMRVRSLSLGVSGQCDVVELHTDGTIFPVEYKRGKPRPHGADEAQLCAQALCLEEMLGRPVSRGALFYDKTKRRVDVEFDASLRALTEEAAAGLRAMMTARRLPRAEYERGKCDACSLINLCQPRSRADGSAAEWFTEELLRDEAAAPRAGRP